MYHDRFLRDVSYQSTTSSNQTKVNFVKEMCTAIQKNMYELQQENTSDVEGTTHIPPKDKEQFYPEEGDLSHLH